MARSILVTGANQGLGMHTVHQLASTPQVLVLMGERPVEVGLRPNAEEALAKFASDIRPTSTVVPVQLDIIDHTSIGAAHALLATTLIVGHKQRAATRSSTSPGFRSIVYHTISLRKPVIPAYAAYVSSKAALNALTVHWALQEVQAESGGARGLYSLGYTGTSSLADGCKVIVKAALEKEGRTAVFFNRGGDTPW
ncbi:hypothetical protein C8R44DRAFT_728484 [Mycena epipterygia]|nr:hypothetical protein C8R44DRAFT_728484 [Mycena epipterygia]